MSSIIAALPSELHLDIFHALYSHPYPVGEKLAKQDSIRTVSQVCRLWRKLALTTSFFWTFIFIDERSVDLQVAFSDPYAVDYAGVFRIFPWVAAILERSGAQPIDVYINLRSESYSYSLGEHENEANFSWTVGHALLLSRILGAYAARFRTVDVYSQIWMPLQALGVSLAGIPMPMLESWTVACRNFRRGHEVRSDLPPGACMPAIECPQGISPTEEICTIMYPKLHTLHLHGILQNWGRLIPRNLVSIHISYLPLDSRPTGLELKALLLASQFTLESLTLWASTPVDVVNEELTLPKLTSLTLGISFPMTATALVHHLDMPNLRQLHLYDMTHENPSNTVNEESMSEATWILYDFLMDIVDAWPMSNLTHLTLSTPSFHAPEFDEVDAAFTAGEVYDPGYYPIPLIIFFACTSLKSLHLLHPDIATLKALISPVRRIGIPSGVFPLPNLGLLRIKMDNLTTLATFFTQNSHWCGCPLVTPRKVDTILLDVPPSWGTTLRSTVAGNTAKQVLNASGYFEVRSGDPSMPPSRVSNLLSN